MGRLQRDLKIKYGTGVICKRVVLQKRKNLNMTKYNLDTFDPALGEFTENTFDKFDTLTSTRSKTS
jgi:hypothetical protein